MPPCGTSPCPCARGMTQQPRRWSQGLSSFRVGSLCPFAVPVIREGSVARLPGAATRAEEGARACADPARAAQAIKEYLDPEVARMTFMSQVDPGVGDRLGPEARGRFEAITELVKVGAKRSEA
eukprot:11475946-Alexandrium_andersonii.AAC.1